MRRRNMADFEPRLPDRYAGTYTALFDADVPMDLSISNILISGLRSILGDETLKNAFERTPSEELSRLRGELSRLEHDVEQMEASRDEQLDILRQRQFDRAAIDKALLELEKRLFELQALLGMELITEKNEGRPR